MITQPYNFEHLSGRRSHRRMLVAQLVSAALLALVLVLSPGIRFEFPSAARDVLEVQLGEQQVEEIEDVPEVEPAEEIPETEAADETAATVADVTPPQPAETAERTPPRIDWHAELETIARRSDEFVEKEASLNPALDAKIKAAAIKYAASRAPVEKPIWDNVETDQMGRKILRHKGCHRVIEDNAVTRRWVQENFTQYIVFCESYEEEAPIQVVFEEDRFAGYAYLVNPDGSDESVYP